MRAPQLWDVLQQYAVVLAARSKHTYCARDGAPNSLAGYSINVHGKRASSKNDKLQWTFDTVTFIHTLLDLLSIHALIADSMTSLSTKLAEREAAGNPIQVGLIGAGKFGSML